MFYTFSERTEKKCTVGQAVKTAQAVLKDKGVNGVCVNAVSRRDYSEAITTVEMNNIVDAIVDDSIYHAN